MNRLPSIRRWGVAALTGVTLFGGLSIVGAGVASAATAPTVTVALNANATATTILGTDATPQAGSTLNFSVTGVIAANDVILLTVACPSTGSALFDSTSSAGAVTSTAGTVTLGAAALVTGTSSNCNSLEFPVATSTGTTATSVTTFAVTPKFDTTAVSPQALTVSGTYSTIGALSSYTVPSPATVQWYSVTSNTPAVTLPASGTSSISPISITEPANLVSGQLASGDVITLALSGTNTWGASAPNMTVAGATVTNVAGTGTGTLTLTLGGITGTGSVYVSLDNPSITIVGNPIGSQTVAIAAGPVGATVSVATVSVGQVLGQATSIYGADGTADGTVAAEFRAAYPNGNSNVVLATDTPHTNGSDALAASYLEGTLHTGLLITPATTLGADAIQAIQYQGVQTVYVVGGPLAISPAVIAQIQALPAYNFGGVTRTGSNVTVVGPIYGADGTAEGTAAAIATKYGTAYGIGDFHGAYNTSGGLYNSTTGAASTTAPVGAVPTAIVVASTDWQDAMSIAPEAFATRFPVILTGPSSSTTLGTDAQTALTTLGVKQVILVGGQLAVQNSVEAQIAALNGGISVLRIAGIDATDTAAKIANFALASTTGALGLGWTAGTSTNHAVLASHGDYWTDALGAAALGGGANPTTYGFEPIILTENPTTVGQYTTAELAVLGGLTPAVTNLTVLGGPLAMPATTINTLLAGL